MSTATISETRIKNSYRIYPQHHQDSRGSFYEQFRADQLADVIGYPLTVGQVNFSVSCRDTIRGIHGTPLSPGQAKLVTCVSGSIMDVIVDLRVGSPTFGEHEVTFMDEKSGTSVYLADGLGHAFHALSDNAAVSYMCSEEYVPGTMLVVDPLDAEIGIPWKLDGPPIISDKDSSAPSLSQAKSEGLLPEYSACLEHYAALRRRGGLPRVETLE